MAEAGKAKTKAADTRWFGKRPGLFVSNSRFYILLFSVLISIVVVSYFRGAVSSDVLYKIRVQQVYGFTALFFWYLALLATPLSSIFGKAGFMRQYLYARRALGVSAAYFATLHMLFGIFGQIGGVGNLFLLPSRFQAAILLGSVALVFLLLMAVTSFDKVIAWMTFPRWKWLHRLGYIGAILVFLHVWMIGTHTGYAWVRWGFFWALVLLAALESWRGAKQLQKRFRGIGQLSLIIVFITFFVWSVALIAYLPRWVKGYHQSHVNIMEH